MPARLRRIVALALAAWFLVLGCGYAVAVTPEVQHDLEWVQKSAPGEKQGTCGHGCVGHLSAHMLVLEQPARTCPAERCRSSLLAQLDARVADWQSDPFSPPPDSLA